MIRLIAHNLVLLTLAASTLAAIPCACEAGEVHASAAESAQSESGDCCTGLEAAAEPLHGECPHCLAGGCDVEGLAYDDGPVAIASSSAPTRSHVVSGSTNGFECVTPLPEYRPPEHVLVAWPASAPSGWGKCVRNQVIRC